MKTREISEATAISTGDRGREDAITRASSTAAGKFPSFLREQTHYGCFPPILRADARSTPDLELPAPGIQPEANPASVPSQPDSVLAKGSHHTPVRPIPPMQFANGFETRFPLPVREQTHFGPTGLGLIPTGLSAPESCSAAPHLQNPLAVEEQTQFSYPHPSPSGAARCARDLELPVQGMEPELHPVTLRSPQPPVLAKRSHHTGPLSIPASQFSTGSATIIPLSLREQSHFGPVQPGRIPTGLSSLEPCPAAPHLQNPSSRREQTHCAAAHATATMPSKASLAAWFPSSLRDQTQVPKPSSMFTPSHGP